MRTNGVATATPATSPSHHVHQLTPYADQGMKPSRTRLVTPQLQAVKHIKRAMGTNLRKSSTRWRKPCAPAQEFSRNAPTSAWVVDPTPMASASVACAPAGKPVV